MSSIISPNDHEAKVRWLLKETRVHNGLAPLDLDRFWADHQLASADPFSPDIPQVPLGIMMGGECVYDELGVPEDYWRYDHDEPWRLALNKAYNDRAEQIVGRRLLSEIPDDPTSHYPPTRQLHDLFEAKNLWIDRSWWLQQSAHDEDELRALLDRVEQRLNADMRSFLLPPEWDREKQRLMSRNIKPPLYRWQRGPVTFACSIFGPENLILLIHDNPDLAIRFRDLILRGMLTIARVLDEEAGHTPATAPRGFGFADDNCCLLNAEMYELFGFPVLKGIWDQYCPAPHDWRYQHSDSAMGHLLPVLSRLDLRGVNFGPTLTVTDIRRHLPHAVIEGQLAPFTFSRNDEQGIIREFLRDFDQARDQRGLRFMTAGSINNGSRLTGMRLIMSAIQHFGRYARPL
jgi:uroporphyrinogen decarboxylase